MNALRNHNRQYFSGNCTKFTFRLFSQNTRASVHGRVRSTVELTDTSMDSPQKLNLLDQHFEEAQISSHNDSRNTLLPKANTPNLARAFCSCCKVYPTLLMQRSQSTSQCASPHARRRQQITSVLVTDPPLGACECLAERRNTLKYFFTLTNFRS